MRHTGTGALANAWAAGNGGAGSLFASASARCATYASTAAGVALGSASSTSREAVAALMPGWRE